MLQPPKREFNPVSILLCSEDGRKKEPFLGGGMWGGTERLLQIREKEFSLEINYSRLMPIMRVPGFNNSQYDAIQDLPDEVLRSFQLQTR